MKDIGAIILAAGASSRMGQCKAVMSLGQTRILEHIIATLHKVGIGPVCVVTGFHRKHVSSCLQGWPRVFEAQNPRPQEGMFSSLCVGLHALAGQCQAMFILPVDIPLIRPCTFHLLQKAWQQHPNHVCIPVLETKNGHPPLLPASLAPNILNWDGDQGLRGFLASRGQQVIPVQVPDEYMLMDMDTQTAYERILTAWQRYAIPTRRECLALIRHVLPIPANILAHSLMVAALARVMGDLLNQHGGLFDLALLEAAGLVHDIARLEPHHGPRGAAILTNLGFDEVAEVIAPHSDMEVAPHDPITHQEILFLADKYMQGDQPASLTDRYQAKMEQYGITPHAQAHIRQRLAHARHSQARFQAQTGVMLDDLARQVAATLPPTEPGRT